MNNYHLKSDYCTNTTRNCTACDISSELLDCNNNPIEYCIICHEVVGTNQEDCSACWAEANPGYCPECGQLFGVGAKEDCFICTEYLKDQDCEIQLDNINLDGDL